MQILLTILSITHTRSRLPEDAEEFEKKVVSMHVPGSTRGVGLL